MTILKRSNLRPNPADLPDNEARLIYERFDIASNEVIVDGQPIRWEEIEEVEVAPAPRAAGPAGWLVRNLVHGDERYHVGLYFGRSEAVLPNISLNVARFVVQAVAYYAPLPVRYRGPDGLSPTVEEP
ncbi:MAG: hypothetical protein JNM70_08620 [Anaerolineae bacterium]|nr:hypothetical protein [Anaerolineae bacterium]